LNNFKGLRSYPFYFIAFYLFLYMGFAVFSVFMPVYLDELGYDNSDIGTLLSLGSFVGLFAQPLWGIISDRSKTKNNVLKVLALLSSLGILLFGVSGNYFYIFSIMIVFSFFQSPIVPISDSITLEYISSKGWKFGPIRLAGTIGYAVMPVLAGAMIKNNTNIMFFLCFVIGFMMFLSVFMMPKVKGHQSSGRKTSIFELLKNRELMLLLGFTVVVQITIGYYNSFFSIYYKEMGADNSILGWATFIACMSEVVFLLIGDRVIKRFGIKLTMICAAFIAVFRWALMGVVNNIYLILILQLLHGFTFIVIFYSMAMYINEKVQDELKASGQALNSAVGMGFTRIIGSVAGGVLSDYIGIRQVFTLSSIAVLVSIIVFVPIFMAISRKSGIKNT
jgi:PPP family 3-phenylpropionic acid transporter